MRRISASLIALSLLASTAAQALTREEIAAENYRRIVNGQLDPNYLTPQERADVAEIDRRLREEADQRSSEQKCYDEEIAKLGPEPTYLARRSTALKCGISLEDAESGQAE